MRAIPILPKIPKPGDKVKKSDVDFIAEEIRKTFLETVSTWNHKPTFVKEVSITKNRVRIQVYTIDKIYGYVVFGTKEHDIPTKGYAFMRFQTGYRSKTTPSSRKARAGGSSGPTVIRAKVHHPGTDPRPFPTMLKKYWLKRFPPMIKAAFLVYTRALGAK